MNIKFTVFFVIALLLGLSIDANSQAVRKVLFEEWTSSTCGPCAANNPVLNAFIEAHADTITAVKYHVGWPSPGNDPMYRLITRQSP